MPVQLDNMRSVLEAYARLSGGDMTSDQRWGLGVHSTFANLCPEISIFKHVNWKIT